MIANGSIPYGQTINGVTLPPADWEGWGLMGGGGLDQLLTGIDKEKSGSGAILDPGSQFVTNTVDPPVIGGFPKGSTPTDTGSTTNTAGASQPDPPRQNFDGSWEVPGLPGSWPTREAAIAATGASGGGGASPVDETLTQLPGSAASMDRMRALQMQGLGGLESLLARDLTGERKRMEDAYYGPQADEINYAIDKDMRTGLEAMGGRNMLTSSVTGDYVLAPLARERASRLANARNTAITSAAGEQRADLNTQMQMLGQAFNSGTTGLQSEQNVNQANTNRATQVSEAEKNRTQQESQFGRSLGQQKELQESAFENARDIAGSNALSSGIGGLASFFAPSANNFLANTLPSLFGPQR